MFKHSLLVNTLALVIARVEAVGFDVGGTKILSSMLLVELMYHVFLLQVVVWNLTE